MLGTAGYVAKQQHGSKAIGWHRILAHRGGRRDPGQAETWANSDDLRHR